jgi:hypothetical protein
VIVDRTNRAWAWQRASHCQTLLRADGVPKFSQPDQQGKRLFKLAIAMDLVPRR